MEYVWSRFSGSEGSFSRVILREAGLAQLLTAVPMLIMSPLPEDVKERKHQGVLPTKSKIHFSQNLKQHLLRVKGILPTTVLLDTVACIIVVETHFRCLFDDCGARRVSSNPWNFPSSPPFPYFPSPSPPLYPPPSQLESNFHIPILLCTQRGAFYWILLLTTWHLVE